jgi:hypothetical protein
MNELPQPCPQQKLGLYRLRHKTPWAPLARKVHYATILRAQRRALLKEVAGTAKYPAGGHVAECRSRTENLNLPISQKPLETPFCVMRRLQFAIATGSVEALMPNFLGIF